VLPYLQKIKNYLVPDNLFIFIFGCSSGMLLMLSGNTLNFWLAKIGINLKTIGLFSLIALPYAIKYLIAPFIEKYNPAFLTKRKSWLALLAILIFTFASLLGNSKPEDNIYSTAILGFLLALVSVTTDIVLDSYRVDISSQNKSFGSSSATFVFGYKIGMLFSGAGAIFLSRFIEWRNIYIFFASIISILIIYIIAAIPDYQTKHEHKETPSLFKIFLKPLNQFSTFKELFIVVAFVLVYKIADNFVLSMINPFLLSLGYDEYDISFVAKTFGFLGSILGATIGGVVVSKYGIKNCLFYSGLLHMLTNLLFIIQYFLGYNLPLLYALTAYGTISAGMTISVYISYIMSISSGQFSGTKYAFFSSLMGFSRVILPSASGFIVESINWSGFFILMFIISVPGLVLTRYLPQDTK